MKKRIGAVCMAALSLLSLGACNETTGYTGDGVEIVVLNFNGGVGTEWLENAAKRFEGQVKDKTYPDGSVGVHVDVQKSKNISTATMADDAYNIYFLEGQANVYSLAQEKKLACVNDILEYTVEGESETIGDKMDAGYKNMLTGEDGNYYALPHYEWYPGLSYDMNLFDSGKYYFAKPEATNARSPKNKTFGDIKFVNDLADKSCGPDGKYGTQDDGLPSSIQELLILCSELQATGCIPMALSGMYKQYAGYLVAGLWASLDGLENTRANFNFEAEEYEIVTGYNEGTELFQGFTGIETPQVKTIKMTEENAVYTFDSSARYYAATALKAIANKNWITTFSINTSHTDTQQKFIFGGSGGNKKIGMLIDGSYWWNESREAGTFDNFKEYYPGKERNFGFMPLPTQVNGSVTENNGKAPSLLDFGNSYCLLNANIKDESVMEACKDFLKFLYSDKELSAFTATTGCARNLKYDLTSEDQAQLSGYAAKVWELRGKDGANIAYGGSDKETFLSDRSNLRLNLLNAVFKPRIGTTTFTNYYEAFTTDASTKAKDVFELTKKAR